MISKRDKDLVAKRGKDMWLSRKSNVEDFIKSLKKVFKDVKGLKVLDAGCAQGRDSAEIASFGLKVTGLDYNREFIEEARKEHPEIKFDSGDIMNLPYDSEEFDAVYCVNTLFYMKPEESLPELSRVLKKKGLMFITLDRKIINLDKNEITHELDVKKTLKILDGFKVVDKTHFKRIDEVPFRHEHDFYEIALIKRLIS